MRDPAGPPTWLMIVVGLAWAFAFGVWRERNRPGGTKDQVADLETANAELLETVDELVAQHARAQLEVVTRRNAAMHAHPSSACCDQRDLHLIRGGRS